MTPRGLTVRLCTDLNLGTRRRYRFDPLPVGSDSSLCLPKADCMTLLLVSVRSVFEAAEALAGGAALIDVKEPASGSLGRADAGTTTDILRFVAGRQPVSAALGELTEGALPSTPGLTFVKWGLAGCARRNWRRDLVEAGQRLSLTPGYGAPVATTYADWQRADSPSP